MGSYPVSTVTTHNIHTITLTLSQPHTITFSQTFKCTLTHHTLTHPSDSEDLLARTVIVGIIMAFRKLTLEALNNVLTYRVPFMLSSIVDFKHNLPDKTSSVRGGGGGGKGGRDLLRK